MIFRLSDDRHHHTQRFLMDSYTGGGGYADGEYLVPYPRETEEKLAARRRLLYYPNYVRLITKTHHGYCWKRPPDRRYGTGTYELFCRDADGRGTKIDKVMARAQLLSWILGTVFIVVDKPQEMATNRAEEIEQRLYPYVVLRTPLDLADFHLGPRGLERISFRSGLFCPTARWIISSRSGLPRMVQGRRPQGAAHPGSRNPQPGPGACGAYSLRGPAPGGHDPGRALDHGPGQDQTLIFTTPPLKCGPCCGTRPLPS